MNPDLLLEIGVSIVGALVVLLAAIGLIFLISKFYEEE